MNHVCFQETQRQFSQAELQLEFIPDYLTLSTHRHTEKLSSERVGLINLRLSGRAFMVLGELLIRHE